MFVCFLTVSSDLCQSDSPCQRVNNPIVVKIFSFSLLLLYTIDHFFTINGAGEDNVALRRVFLVLEALRTSIACRISFNVILLISKLSDDRNSVFPSHVIVQRQLEAFEVVGSAVGLTSQRMINPKSIITLSLMLLPLTLFVSAS